MKMMKLFETNTRTMLALVLIGGLAGCGDDADDPTGPDGELTQAEAEAMTEAFFTAGGFGLGAFGGGFEPADSGARGVPIGPETIDRVVECPEGGTVALQGQYSGDIDEETGEGTLDFTLTQTHDACAASASDGSVWSFDGDPNVATDFDYQFSETSVSLQGTRTGTVQWSGSDANGRCSVDLSWDVSADVEQSSFSGTVSGSFCGFDVSQDLSWDLEGV